MMGFGLVAVVSRYLYHGNSGCREDLLSGAAKYLRGYSGENPGEAIEDALKILEIAEKTGVRDNGVAAVKQECLRVRDTIGGSVFHSRYNPAFASLAERIEALA